MISLDRWAVACALDAQKEIKEAYDNYQFHTVVQRLMRFCSVEMGSFYLDIIKDRQYTTKADSLARRSCQNRFMAHCRSVGTLDGTNPFLYGG